MKQHGFIITSVTTWIFILLCMSIQQATSFAPYPPNIVEYKRNINLHQNQYARVATNHVVLPTPIHSATQLSMLSIRNVIATALHHNPDDHHVMMAGSIWPILQKLLSAPMKFRLILHNIVSITEWQECILLPLLAFGITPLAKLYYRVSGEKERPMHEMKRFGAVAVIDQISKVALSVYAMDVISITLTTMGFSFAKQWRIAEVYAKLACKLY